MEDKAQPGANLSTGAAGAAEPLSAGRDLAALLEGVESAEGPNYDLEERVGLALQPERLTHFRTPPRYTSSLDAALALVERCLPGWDWQVWSDRVRGGGAEVTPPNWPVDALHYKTAKTPALALLAALLRALIAQADAATQSRTPESPRSGE